MTTTADSTGVVNRRKTYDTTIQDIGIAADSTKLKYDQLEHRLDSLIKANKKK